MFSLQHVVWLLISLVIATGALILYEKKRPPLERMLTFALFLSIISEICQILSTMVLVPSATSGEMTPYLPLGQLPLHLCYVQMFFIAYARLTKRRDRREYALAFMYPTCISGAVAALLLPNVFRQVAPERSFFSPLCYRFFLYHTMLFVLGVIIVRSGEIRWKKRHFTV